VSDWVVLTLRAALEHPLEASCIAADRLAALGEREISALPIRHDGRAGVLGDLFTVRGERAARVRVVGGLDAADGIGTGMAGGELVIEHSYGAQSFKLPAGHMVLYPSTSLHRVAPVTRGERLVSFLWLQSMVRDEDQRTILFDFDQSIQTLVVELGLDHAEVIRLSGLYHNLVRRWAEI